MNVQVKPNIPLNTGKPSELRDYIAMIERDHPKEILRITDEIDPAKFEATAILANLEEKRLNPMVIFERPINQLEDRIEVLAALSCVDHVVAFGEDDPRQLIRSVRPHVFVKGGDYTRERLPEAAVVEELGGTVVVLPYEADRSTTGIIDRIRVGQG